MPILRHHGAATLAGLLTLGFDLLSQLLLVGLMSCTETPDRVGSDVPPPICNDGNRWEKGDDAFSEATADWGLIDIGASGVRMNAVDFDGDGWTDLTVRGGVEEPMWLLRNTGNGTFEDVTEASEIRRARSGGGERNGPVWIWADVDNDGDLDVYTGLPDGVDGEHSSEILLNDGDGTFSLGPTASPIRRGVDNPYGAAFADFDRDGNIDLFVGNYSQEQDDVFFGDGSGGFEKKTKKAGIETQPWVDLDEINDGLAHSVSWAVVACDVDDNGDTDVLVSSYGRAPNHLWLNNAGAFSNESVASGYAFDHRIDWSDNESARCWCQLNPDDTECDTVNHPPAIACSNNDDAFRWNHNNDREPYRLGGNSGQTVCWDVDNDGDMDLLTSEIVHWDVGASSDPSELAFNDGTGVFTRPGNHITGLTREQTLAAWNDGDITGDAFDFDNDGWPDIWIGSSDYEGTRGLLFHQTDEPGVFESVPIEDGIDHTRAHGSAAADFDRDGDLDFVVGHSRSRCADDCYDTSQIRLFENLSEDHNFLQLELIGGSGANHSAIGARVRVTADGVTQTQEVSGGGGQWGNQADLVLHFGLGESCEAEVSIRWPDGDLSQQTFTVGGGYRYRVTQGKRVITQP